MTIDNELKELLRKKYADHKEAAAKHPEVAEWVFDWIMNEKDETFTGQQVLERLKQRLMEP